MVSDPRPEKIPLNSTTMRGSLPDSRLVQLFSMPQHRHAPRMNNDPADGRRAVTSSKESRAQDRVTRTIPPHRRGEMASRNRHRAMRAVATISKLLRRAALAAVVMDRPSKSRMGAAISSSVRKEIFFTRAMHSKPRKPPITAP